MELQDYNMYRFCKKDWMEFVILLLIKGILVSYLFYDSYFGMAVLFVFSYADYREIKNKKIKQQKRKLTVQFQSLMEAMTTSLNAGYSLESSFEEAKKDLLLIYEKSSLIIKELEVIITGLKMNIPLEKMLLDFGKRSSNEDINNFANVVCAAKKSGGNLIHIIQKTVNCISDKIIVEEEIETMIASKKLEEKIMMVMPYGILFYLRMTNSEYLMSLYHNPLGIILMTVFLLFIYLAGIWAGKIMEICV